MSVKVLNSDVDAIDRCEINLNLCLLCQTSNSRKDHLIDPFKVKGRSISESYITIVDILKVSEVCDEFVTLS